MLPRIVKRLAEWFKGYDDAPLWLCFCRLIFAVSALSFIVLFFGPAIFAGDVIGFWMYQEWSLTHAGFLYIVLIVITFILTVISGIPTFLYEKKKTEIYDHIAVCLPIAVAGAIVGVSAVYTIGMIWCQKILVYIFDGVILLTGFVISQKIKELQRSRDVKALA